MKAWVCHKVFSNESSVRRGKVCAVMQMLAKLDLWLRATWKPAWWGCGLPPLKVALKSDGGHSLPAHHGVMYDTRFSSTIVQGRSHRTEASRGTN